MKNLISHHITKTKSLVQQWQKNLDLKVTISADHIEIADSHLILGLNLVWQNRTSRPLTIAEIKIKIYQLNDPEGLKANTRLDDLIDSTILFHLSPLEGFSRLPNKPFTKTNISRMELLPKENRTQCIRFFSDETLDIPPGIYTGVMQVRDAKDNSFSLRIKLNLENKSKYYLSDLA